jgi:two-component system, sensor histidine kinase
LASVSHDLRQPLHSIALLTGAFQREGAINGVMAGQINASVQAADQMLSALLEVSRLDSGTLPLRLGPLSMEVLLADVAQQFSAQARRQGLSLQFRQTDTWVRSDAYQVRRVLANLVSNAIRYTSQGGVLVRCRTRGGRVWLQVWDSGVGIARADRQRIFDEFVQVSGAVQGGKGLGLGLSIVHKVAQRLGHPLVLRSRVGRGSLFAIGLARLDGAVAQELNTDWAALTQLLEGQSVLLIDDDPGVLRSLQMMLQACQCHVLAADSTTRALALVGQSLCTPDLIISDFHLGEDENGLEAIAQVRALVGESIPAVLVSAHPAAARQAAGSTMEVLAKPWGQPDLVAALRRALAPAQGIGTP